ncbi:hypothetical protein BS50DRAFT_618438 [Corynespora cassiicola Philippines]|uniref:Transcription factor domain-containing protein n=1 Tax=Corynespora cassiicola Philippines TaxID=1448308 RepID=A0A2T2P236_CORCC|nr:hypothetical protein BS50DRAFT_618438 [Corynespora cassiicola Philippines]
MGFPLDEGFSSGIVLDSGDFSAEWNTLDDHMVSTPNTVLSPNMLSSENRLPTIGTALESNECIQTFGPETPLTCLRHRFPANDHVSDLIIACFPLFIHSYWHRPILPEILASCMSIAQLFEARIPDTQTFLWKAIDSEEQNFRENTETMSILDLQCASQALMIYVIMEIMDRDNGCSARSQRLFHTLKTCGLRLRDRLDPNQCSTTEEKHPSATWDDWIFAETNRRISCIWLLICRVFKTFDCPCPDLSNLEHMPLLSPKTVWEARTQEEWRTERDFHSSHSPITKFGELFAARRRPNEPCNAKKLEAWEAGSDKLGFLMNLVVTFAERDGTE